MAVKVLIKRKVPKEKEKELLSLITQLRVLASKENVYISGETMRNAKNPLEYLVISTWQDLKGWKAWLANKERKKIQKEIDSLLGAKTTYDVYYYPDKRRVTLTDTGDGKAAKKCRLRHKKPPEGMRLRGRRRRKKGED